MNDPVTGQDNNNNKSRLENVSDLEDYYNALNELEKQTGIPSPTNDAAQYEPLGVDRWPTLFEILNKKTQSPLDLWSFYTYMRDEENAINYLDFWIDTVQHINLCKAYVKGLRDSLAYNNKVKESEKVNDILDSIRNNTMENLNVRNSTNLNNSTESAVNLPGMEMGPPHTSFTADATESNRNSQNSSRNSRSSSILLDLLMKNNLLEEQDPHRLSMFLRGESAIRTSDPLANAKINELRRKSQIFAKSGSALNLATANEADKSNFRVSKINPEMVETFIQFDLDEKNRSFEETHHISRQELRNSSKQILDTYFKPYAENQIDIPPNMIEKVRYALERQGRDDPEVFDEAREYVFKKMELAAYPNFLRNNALKNVTKQSALWRLLISMVCGLGAFWTGYTLIFMDYQPKPTRAVVVIPFFFMSYFFFSSFYRIDPILCFSGYCESTASDGGLAPLKEPYVRKLLRKRSIFVLIVLCLVAAAFSVIFALVPGRRLTH